jgi:hypothetical protein
MKIHWTALTALVMGLGVLTYLARPAQADREEKGEKKVETRVFELRTYTAAEGKLDALNKRFRDHTCRLFRKHGMTIVGFWTPTDGDGAKTKLIYLLAFPSREAAKKSWNAFRDDEEWKKVRAESEKDGAILAKPPESVFLEPTDYSPMK